LLILEVSLRGVSSASPIPWVVPVMSDLTQPLRVRANSDSQPLSDDSVVPLPQLLSKPSVADLTVASGVAPGGTPGSFPVTFPGYDVLEEIGRGGMGVVYKARQRRLNRYVALKVILSGPHASPENKARFLIEAEAGARLQHPNIVQVYDVGEHAGFSYIALELIEGTNLRNWQAGRPIEPRLAASLVLVLARAVQHAHDQGIIHRDLKPANILLAGSASPGHSAAKAQSSQTGTDPVQQHSNSSGGRTARTSATTVNHLTPKVTDFGLAKAIQGGTDLTVSGVACGTPNYMAPEQIRGSRHLGPAVDVYGLGAVLYELLTGYPPFIGGDAVVLMEQILKVQPLDVRKIVPGVPRDLAVIVNKCLEKEPERRYRTPNDLADDLDRFVRGRPIQARPTGYCEQAWRWVRRNPVPTTFLILLSVGFFVTGALAAALAHSSRVERAARAEAEQAQREANLARNAAEASRDELQQSLLAADQARRLAEQEQRKAEAAHRTADLEKAFALDQQLIAEAARKKAESNLKMARAVIRSTLIAFSQDTRFEGPEFRDFRGKLITTVRSFRNEVAGQGAETIEFLDDIADMSHWLGFLEFLNDNQPRAAAEYLAAAAAACKWIAIAPDDPEPRSRMADSLVNAGNAYYNHQRLADAERCYRQAVATIESVIEIRPQIANYRRVAYMAHLQLASQRRLFGQEAEAIHEAEQALRHAQALNQRGVGSTEYLGILASAHQELARGYSRAKKWDQAECHYSEMIAVRERLMQSNPRDASHLVELSVAILRLAECQMASGAFARAMDQFHHAQRVIEHAQEAEPTNPMLLAGLAEVLTRQGDALRYQQSFPEAEQRYERAMSLVEPLLPRNPQVPQVREAWAKAMTGRAHLYNRTGRHRQAAEQWAKLATHDPDKQRRTEAALFVCQSLLFANDWREAARQADALATKPSPIWMSYEQARLWCLISQQTSVDPELVPEQRFELSEQALAKALAFLEKAKADGLFEEERFVQLVLNNPDLAVVRSRFDPRK
jgi:serine/threonine protein kinase/tetratricopeptide (TPR) repeat protein